MTPLAAEQYDRQRARAAAAVVAARREWSLIGEDFDAGWKRVGTRLATILAAAKLGAAQDGAAWVPYALAAQGQKVPAADGVINARAISRVSAQGEFLDGLLYGAVVHAKTAKVDNLAARITAGRDFLDAVMQTEVQDAGRDATQVAMTARPHVGWVRIVNPPCCQRCAVLAGRIYSHSQGFQRHPRCDCQMQPSMSDNVNIAGVVIGPGDVKDLTAKQRQLIDDGADFNKVVNDYQRKRGDFLPPTRVQRLAAKESRESAVETLTRAGYLAA